MVDEQEALIGLLKDMNAKNAERNQRLDALETRVLELEAAAAARTVTHADE